MPWVEPTESRPLTQEEMQENAKMCWSYFQSTGWTLEAVAGLLGNAQKESTINPTRWQSDTPGEAGGGGYGILQWTPWTKLINYGQQIGGNWQTGTTQVQVVNYNLDIGVEYYPTREYPLTGDEFRKSTQTPEYLAYAWLYNYERPADYNQPDRQTYARYWYDYLSGVTPPVPPTPTTRKRRPDFPWFLFMR